MVRLLIFLAALALAALGLTWLANNPGVVDVTWPPDRPLDPTQTNENAVRQRILELFSTDLVRYFYDHIEQVGGEGIRARSH